jgi:mannose-1-phosphate guanylyltransferase/mannose-6-phosphate isomerase
MAIHPVIMCGGAGTRLWPVSNQACPKQFHRLVSDKTVFQETVLRFAGAEGFHAQPVIISNAAYAGLIADQLAAIGVTPAAILLEPEGRNTAAVAAVAARFLADAFPDGLGLLVPSDHFIGRPDVFLGAVRAAAPVAADGFITTFGIAPSRPDTGFGYIQSGAPLSGPVARVAAFKEKPDAATAAAYLASGAYSWNAGIFLFSPRTMLAELAAHAPAILEQSAAALALARTDGANIHLDAAAFSAVPSNSIDYAVMEHTAHAAVLAPVDCAWSDIGTWSAVGEVSSRENTPAPVLINSENCLVHAADGQLVALVGVEGLVVVADGNRILVTARDRTQDVGAVVKALKERGLKDFL